MDAKMEQLILDARRVKASDIHITEGMPVWYRVHGKLAKIQLQFSGEELRALLMGSMDERKKKSSLPDEMWTLGWRSVTAAVRGSIFFGSSIRWQRPSAC